MTAAMLVAILFSSSSQAESAAPEVVVSEARYVISLPVLPLLAGSVSLQGERYFGDNLWSIAANLGARSSTSGDYGSLRLFAGVEGKRWLGHMGPLSATKYGQLGGAFAWARFDIAWNRMVRSGGELVGTGLLTSESVGFGYRLLPWWRLEVTPSAGIAVNHVDAARNWASAVRVTAVLGLTVGVVF